jgi:hypothetical protein
MNLLNGQNSTDSAVTSLDLEVERERMNNLVGLTGQTNSPKVSNDPDQDDALFAEKSDVDQPFERTQSRFWEKGSSHIIFIGVAAALVMGLLLSVYNSIAGGGGNTQTAKAPDPAKKSDFFDGVPKDGTGDWKTQAALADQKAAMRNLKKPPVVAAKVPPTVKPVAAPPVVRAAYIPPASPAPTIQSRIPEYSPPPAPTISAPSFVPPAPPPSLDETQKKWEALGKIASWGAEDNGVGYGSAQSAYTPAVATSPIPQGQLIANAQPLAPAPDESSVFSGIPKKTVAIGTRVAGKLETPIVASAQSGDRFVVSLKQPLKATDGSTVLPQGTQIIVKVDGVSGGGLMRVSAISASGENGDVPFPQGAIEIRGEKGRPLIAQNLNKPKGNGLLKNLALFGIGGLSRGAQLFNQPISSVAAVNSGSTIITNTNPAPDYIAGMLEGGTSAVLPGIQTSLQSNGVNNNIQEPLWSIKSSTDIEIFVNQTVSI